MKQQEQIRIFLTGSMGFVLTGRKPSSLGDRFQFSHSSGLNAEAGSYRICFFAGEGAPAASNLPPRSSPRCFDLGERVSIRKFLEPLLGIEKKKKRKRRKTFEPHR